MAHLTQQQSDPHPQLVACRNVVEAALKGDSEKSYRKEAAHVCTYLSHEQVDAILSAGSPKDVLEIITPAKEVAAELKEEAEQETAMKKTSKSKK